MPNWASNHGTIQGSPEVIKTIAEVIKANPEDHLTAFHPIPEELKIMSGFMASDNPEKPAWVAQQEANIAKHGYADWYGWSIDNWGTKWCPDFEFTFEDEYISFHGDSAWSPPSALMAKITELFPVTITLEYTEESNAYIGATVFHAGNAYCHDEDVKAEIDWDAEEPDWDAYYDALDSQKAHCVHEAEQMFAKGEGGEPVHPTFHAMEVMVSLALEGNLGKALDESL